MDKASGLLLAIFTAPRAKAPMQTLAEAEAVPGRGLRGDRYFEGRGAMSRWPGPAREVTLIAAEVIEEAAAALGAPLDPALTRRNLIVSGLALDGLLKRRFRIGTAIFEGVQRCHPCAYLERVTGVAGIFASLKGRGGLRARVVEPGVLRVGDSIEALEATGRPLP